MNLIKKTNLILLLVILLVSFTGCQFETITIKSNDENTLVIGIDENYPPFGFIDNDEYVGFDISLAQAVTEYLNMDLEIVSINWADKDELIENDEIDAIWNGFTISEDREEQFIFTDPYIEIQAVLVVRDDSEISSIEDLEDKIIGVQDGSYAQNVLESLPVYDLLDHVTIFEENSSALKNLYVGLTDAVIVDSSLANWYIYSKNANYKVVDSVEDLKIGVAFSKSNQELRDKVNNALNILKENGVAEEISMQWFGKNLII